MCGSSALSARLFSSATRILLYMMIRPAAASAGQAVKIEHRLPFRASTIAVFSIAFDIRLVPAQFSRL
jgi:hypothetical protein